MRAIVIRLVLKLIVRLREPEGGPNLRDIFPRRGCKISRWAKSYCEPCPGVTGREQGCEVGSDQEHF